VSAEHLYLGTLGTFHQVDPEINGQFRGHAASTFATGAKSRVGRRRPTMAAMGLNLLGWTTTLLITPAALGLVYTML
jgi:hypothetical protein